MSRLWSENIFCGGLIILCSFLLCVMIPQANKNQCYIINPEGSISIFLCAVTMQNQLAHKEFNYENLPTGFNPRNAISEDGWLGNVSPDDRAERNAAMIGFMILPSNEINSLLIT